MLYVSIICFVLLIATKQLRPILLELGVPLKICGDVHGQCLRIPPMDSRKKTGDFTKG